MEEKDVVSEKKDTVSGVEEGEESCDGGEKCNYQEALKDLSNIALSGKRILEEDSGSSSSSKRVKSTRNEEDEPEEKDEPVEKEEEEEGGGGGGGEEKEEEGSQSVALALNPSSPGIEGLKKEFKKMSRSELEDLVLKKMVAFLCCESEIGALRQKCDYYDEMNDKWKKKVQALQKQCQDLNTVMQRYIKDVSNKSKDKVTPVRVTRSVGLQVATDRKRISIHQPKATQEQKQAIATAAPSMKKITNNSSLTVLPVADSKQNTSVKSTPESSHNRSIISTNRSEVSNNKSPGVIDLIDLSDEEEDSNSKVALKTSTPARVIRSDFPPLNKTMSGGVGVNNSVIGRASLVPLSNSLPLRGPNPMLQSPQFAISQQRPRLVRLSTVTPLHHPAPLPEQPVNISNPSWKVVPPKPSLKLSRLRSGIVLSWNLDLTVEHDSVLSYQLFAYQESNSPPSSALWKKVGDVKALPLPMACTLTQFMKGNKYHFAIRALDSHKRFGPFSDPSSILLS